MSEKYPRATRMERIQRFNTTKLKRYHSLEHHSASCLAEDPLRPEQEYLLPPGFFNLRKYLTMIKWPLNNYAALELKVTLLDRRVCGSIDRVRQTDEEFPHWSRLDTSNSIPPVFPPPTSKFFTKDVDVVRETFELYQTLIFQAGNEDFKPFAGLKFNISQSIPSFLAKKISIDDIFLSLRTERAFIGQVFCQTDSIRTPEAYKEILKITDIKGTAKI